MSYPKNFTPEETACRCGCGANVEIDFMWKLQAARTIADIPFKIASGARCLERNKLAGSEVSDSAHTLGLAVDIIYSSSRECYITVKALLAVGFNRIGISNGFIHVDDDKSKPADVIWNYYR